MNLKGILSASLILAGVLSSEAQQTKVLTAEKHNEYGLVYSLPTTALQIEVTARKRTRIAGDFYQYSRKYLGTDKVVTEDSEEWTIESVDITPYGIANESTGYLMQLKPGAVTYLGVGEDGMLLSINCAPSRSTSPSPSPAISSSPSSGNGSAREYLQYVNEDFLSSQSKAKQAEMLAASLMEVRDSYISLTRGTADNMPTDGKQLELMLNSLKAQEKALTQAFTGISYESAETRRFTYVPDEEGNSILFRLSSFAGFVGADDYSGDPVTITTRILRKGKLPVDANGEEKKFPKDGIAYNIPGTARISLKYKGTEIFSRDFDMAQYGTVFAVSPQLFTSKKDPSYAIFSDITGGLLEIGSVRNLSSEGTRPAPVVVDTRALESEEAEEIAEPEEETAVYEEPASEESSEVEEVEAEEEETEEEAEEEEE